MNNSEVSIQEIAKQFDLPERKSKIDSLLKMQGVELKYCFCRSTDITRFMICCEKCDEWYHGDCIGLAESGAKCIKKWYCSVCVEKFDLDIVYTSTTKNISSKKIKKNNKLKSSKNKGDVSISTNFQCGKCSNCLQNVECGNKDFIFTLKHSKYRKMKNVSSTKHTSKNKDGLHRKTNLLVTEWRVQQCYGPQCQKKARKNSKYCSEDCGLALAKIRIMSILPHRILERMQKPCIADQLDHSRLNKIREQKKLATEKMKKLNKKKEKLLNLIARAKQLPINENPKLSDEDSKIYCISCGYEIPLRSANRHMAMCFKKFESQTEVVAASKTTDFDIFCDFFDAGKNTYCKRLRFICPDHFKPKKIEENEVCGCPLIEVMSTSIFSGANKYCQQPKKMCDYHYNWEILEVSQIDLQRLHQWKKLGQMDEEEVIIKRQIVNRTGALALLLHSTESADYCT